MLQKFLKLAKIASFKINNLSNLELSNTRNSKLFRKILSMKYKKQKILIKQNSIKIKIPSYFKKGKKGKN